MHQHRPRDHRYASFVPSRSLDRERRVGWSDGLPVIASGQDSQLRAAAHNFESRWTLCIRSIPWTC